MKTKIISTFLIFCIPITSFIVYYISGLLAVISELRAAVIILEEKCALLDIANSSILNSQLKIDEITNVSTQSHLNTGLIVAGFFILLCLSVTISINSETLAKEIAELSAEHASENAHKVIEIISNDVASRSALNNFLTDGLQHNFEGLSSRLDSLLSLF
jgi:hypothetical protein